jgi:alkanesulfonate monooxygenase SsuD/methylene tetrahydromethanopterin reductase-like flavin-dependent oxidoreductase (luciferase family)
VKFGLFYELQLPKPLDGESWDPDAERRLYQEALEQIELADRIGFDYVFEVEHHFLEEYSHSPAPEVFLAAASQRTRDIRLGHGIVLTPPPYNHPARVAERIAALDLVSNGRVEFGTGESSSEMELGGFLVDRDEKKAMWEEATREVCRMMTETPYPGYQGQYFTMPARNVVPKPVQRPHPPLWLAASRRETAMVAGRLGMGSLGFGFETPEECQERVAEYFRLVREECFPIGKAVNPALAVLSSLTCLPTDEEAIAAGVEGQRFFAYSLFYYYNPATGPFHQPGRAHLHRRFRELPTEEQEQQRLGLGGFSGFGGPEPPSDPQRTLWRAAQRGGCIGSPAYLRETLRKYEEAHLDLMIFVAQIGARRHEDVMRSIELFGREVLPEFKERHEQHRRWRAAQLDGVEHPVNATI